MLKTQISMSCSNLRRRQSYNVINNIIDKFIMQNEHLFVYAYASRALAQK